jgi:hypothetical protein
MIRDYNVDPTYSQFARKTIVIPVNEGASVAGVAVGGFRAEFAGTIISAIFRCLALTDADDTVRIEVEKNGSDIVAAVDPVAADTTTTLTVTDSDLADGDLIQLKVTTGAGDALRGYLQLEVRPDLGSLELASPLSNS